MEGILKRSFILLAVLFAFSMAENKYCRISTCDPNIHTLCQYTRNEPAAECGKVHQIALSKAEKEKILAIHDYTRFKVHAGGEIRGYPGPQPSAVYKPNDMIWDDELADIAQKWAEQCVYEHDDCRNVERFNVSQNIAIDNYNAGWKHFKVDTLIQKWSDEVKSFSKDDVKNFQRTEAERKSTLNYNQLVWANSIYLGCGGIKFRYGYYYSFFLVCNYGPEGRIDGQPVYIGKEDD